MEKYQISELADLARTSVRTIRYYLEIGLLPQPATDGKFSIFSKEHLRRLQLIAALKERYLPLKEIRELMLLMTDAEVRTRLKELDQRDDSSPLTNRKSNSAKEYIEDLIRDQQSVRRNYNRPPSAPNRVFENRRSMQPSSLQGELWQRVRVNDKFEIWFPEGLPMEDQMRIREIIIFANKLFGT